MDFETLLASLREMGGEYPETMFDDVSASYNNDMGIANGKVESLVAELEMMKAENLALKSHNYDLIMSGSQEQGEPEGEPTEDDADDSAEETESIDDIFDEH